MQHRDSFCCCISKSITPNYWPGEAANYKEVNGMHSNPSARDDYVSKGYQAPVDGEDRRG